MRQRGLGPAMVICEVGPRADQASANKRRVSRLTTGVSNDSWEEKELSPTQQSTRAKAHHLTTAGRGK